MAKSLCVAYFLWLTGGFFGLHHFYLRRDRQAFVWWSTFGGCFGVGFLLDVLRLPRYVRDANEDPLFVEDFVETLRRNKKPPFSTTRYVGAVVTAYVWGQLYLMAIPQDEFRDVDWSFLNWFLPIPVALAVWTVGNIGREKGTIWIALITAFLCTPLKYFIHDDSTVFLIMVTVSAYAFDNYSKEWRRNPHKKIGYCKRVTTLSACALIYLSIWCSYIYFNGTVTDSEGNEIPVHEAVHHFFTSPWWLDIKQCLHDTYTYAQHHGWYEVWKQVVDMADPQGERNAYKVLELKSEASQQEITAAWRRLSKEHHPDKAKDETQRSEAQERFVEVQKAYEILSKHRHRRNKMNKKDNTDL